MNKKMIFDFYEYVQKMWMKNKKWTLVFRDYLTRNKGMDSKMKEIIINLLLVISFSTGKTDRWNKICTFKVEIETEGKFSV